MYKTTVRIEGMACGMCESHINDVIRKTFPNVKKVSSFHKKNESTFLTDEKINGDDLKQAIEETGYHYRGYTCEPYEKKGLFGR